MVVWEFTIDSDVTEFYFPIKEEEKDFDMLCNEYFDKSLPFENYWERKIMLSGEPKKSTDFYEIKNTGMISISKPGIEVFNKVLEGKKELLPILTDLGEFFALNNLNYINCLDVKNSSFSQVSNGLISTYTNLSFISNKIKNEYLFKIPELPYTNFITSNFKDYYYKGFLAGLDFESSDHIVWRE